MRIKELFLLLVAMSLIGCGEAGVQTDIAKTTEVSFDIIAEEVNRSTNGYQLDQVIDFASTEFEEYIQNATSFKIEKLQIEVSGLPEVSTYKTFTDVSVKVDHNEGSEELLSAEGLELKNTGRLLVFEEGNPINLLTATQISTLENISAQVLAQKEMEFILNAHFSGPLQSDFKVTLYFDMVARVELK